MDEVEVTNDLGTKIALVPEFDLPVHADGHHPGQLQFLAMVLVELDHTELTLGGHGPAAKIWRMVCASGALLSASRQLRSEKCWASSESICRCARWPPREPGG
ncbi:MAG: hypothetical protein AW12_01703 [Candidatus Accumulibacter sp. BA-94]|nr:MAG: hypothetical protein AW12_01703 [Candidatus Accumulibacter sp. BA-94]